MKTLDLFDILSPDALALAITNKWCEWSSHKDSLKNLWVENYSYVYAKTTRDVTTTSAAEWNNCTVIPKICQIVDNLLANYMQTLFPRRKWLTWEGKTESSEQLEVIEAIREYMYFVIRQAEFKVQLEKCLKDYILCGNTFGSVDWVDNTSYDPETGEIKPAFVGPVINRISPFDIVFNPTARSFAESPKIIRSIISRGEVKKWLNSMSLGEETRALADSAWEYMRTVRKRVSEANYADNDKSTLYRIDGFPNFTSYLNSDTVELLTFYGDFYDEAADELKTNRVIVVADRHKILLDMPHPTKAGSIPIFHVGWRTKPDNLWAMGPLDNLIGMQYRINQVENQKADLLDLTVAPPIMVKGQVQDFEWAPFERIYLDGDGDIQLLTPKVDPMLANIEIQQYEQKMEEMAGAPKEAMGFRTPGEKTMYEVQRLENAASRLFASKTMQFEEQFIEPLLNAMLAEARFNLSPTTIRIIDDQYKSVGFMSITKEQLSASGVIKPIGARHFAEKAELVQNLGAFFQGPIGSDPEIKLHFSAEKLAKMFEEILDLEDWETVIPFIRISEQAQAQKEQMNAQEQVQSSFMTPAGISPEDYNDEAIQAQSGMDQELIPQQGSGPTA